MKPRIGTWGFMLAISLKLDKSKGSLSASAPGAFIRRNMAWQIRALKPVEKNYFDFTLIFTIKISVHNVPSKCWLGDYALRCSVLALYYLVYFW